MVFAVTLTGDGAFVLSQFKYGSYIWSEAKHYTR